MKKIKLLRNYIPQVVLFAVAIGIVTLSSCNKDDDNDPTQTILEIVENTEGLDSLAKYLNKYPSLTAVLESEGSFTLFAPTNTAFISLLNIDGFPPTIEEVNPDIIANVLAYHVSATRYSAGDLTSGVEIETQSEGNELITVNEDGTLLTGSTTTDIEIITANIAATNGIVHTVGSVLIPVSMEGIAEILPTTAGVIRLGAPFSILAEGLAKADIFAATDQNEETVPLTGILIGTTDHTIFAPTNDTFEELEITADTYTGEQWYYRIANHVVMDDITPEELLAAGQGIQVESAAGVTISISDIGELGSYTGIAFFSNGDQLPDAELVLPDAKVKDNGRIHVIAGFLDLPAQ